MNIVNETVSLKSHNATYLYDAVNLTHDSYNLFRTKLQNYTACSKTRHKSGKSGNKKKEKRKG